MYAIRSYYELQSGSVGVVVFADVNPAYALPSETFRSLISRVLYRFSLSEYAGETSKFCSIFVPVNHYLVITSYSIHYTKLYELYWHFVDLVWIFLFPTLYLIF